MKRSVVAWIAALFVAGSFLTGCGSGIERTYSDGAGSVLLEVPSAGKRS